MIENIKTEKQGGGANTNYTNFSSNSENEMELNTVTNTKENAVSIGNDSFLLKIEEFKILNGKT